MRIVVISDTHRNFNTLYSFVMKQKDCTDLFLHLGDGEEEIEDLKSVEPNLPLHFVRGNCDYASFAPDKDIITVNGITIFMTHGHLYGVKYGLSQLKTVAKRFGAQVALYGHTHCQQYIQEDGIHLLNPGSLTRPRDGKPGFAVLEIRKGQVHCHLARL